LAPGCHLRAQFIAIRLAERKKTLDTQENELPIHEAMRSRNMVGFERFKGGIVFFSLQ
jgi:hypothetical protein